MMFGLDCAWLLNKKPNPTNNNNNNFNLQSIPSGTNGLLNNYNQNFYQFKTDYSQEIKLLDKTKWSTGLLADRLEFETNNFNVKNLDYWRTTISAYSEFNTSYKKFDFIAIKKNFFQE